jgi:hypothetical protein
MAPRSKPSARTICAGSSGDWPGGVSNAVLKHTGKAQITNTMTKARLLIQALSTAFKPLIKCLYPAVAKGFGRNLPSFNANKMTTPV